MFLSCKYATLALPIRAFTSASDPPCSSMIPPRYVKVFTSSKSSPSIVIGLVHAVLYRRTVLFPLCILRPIDAGAAATLVVFSYICCCVWDKKARSSAKFRSSNCIPDVHCIACFPSDVDDFMIHASAGMLSVPAALTLLICLMAMLISSIVGGSTSIRRLVGAASMLGGFSEAGRFNSSLKCSTHLFPCSSTLEINWPSLLFTGRSGLRRFPESFFVMSYRCFMLPSLAAFFAFFARSFTCLRLSFLMLFFTCLFTTVYSACALAFSALVRLVLIAAFLFLLS
ncbi:unnamed protein product [Schistosoma margrebowiei]|uniref:Uncharacterized protein n=1 Tax=Schistosoma margrebowiei TaxID=48269 RepID=A0A183MRA6_9TREM|nr:unnamed protein product [Schistosoma margrebowiei]